MDLDMLLGDDVEVRPIGETGNTVPAFIQERQQNPVFAQNMLQTISEVDTYAWNRGEIGGMDWGFEGFNKAFEGLNTGVHLVAGQSNIGKSGICMQLAWQIAKANRVPTKTNPRKAFVIYFSLDDSNNELMPRMVAIDQKIPINAVRFPKKYQDNLTVMEKRENGLRNLRDSVMNLAMMDSDSGNSIEHIERITEYYAQELSQIDDTYNLVLIIDNFHDVTVEDKAVPMDSRHDHVADKLNELAVRYDCPIVCTAEFRKLNGNRRPKLDDIR